MTTTDLTPQQRWERVREYLAKRIESDKAILERLETREQFRNHFSILQVQAYISAWTTLLAVVERHKPVFLNRNPIGEDIYSELSDTFLDIEKGLGL